MEKLDSIALRKSTTNTPSTTQKAAITHVLEEFTFAYSRSSAPRSPSRRMAIKNASSSERPVAANF